MLRVKNPRKVSDKKPRILWGWRDSFYSFFYDVCDNINPEMAYIFYFNYFNLHNIHELHGNVEVFLPQLSFRCISHLA